MAHRAPGKSYREGLTLIDLFNLFPDEAAAEGWFESIVWPEKRCCPHCGSLHTAPVKSRKPMPYRCRDCRHYFCAKTGTALAQSPLPYRTWALAIYLCLTSLKSISSMKLHRDLGVRQATAWHMLHRIRAAWDAETDSGFTGPVEGDESYFGGREANKHEGQKRHAGRGAVGKTAVVGVKDRASNQVAAQVVTETDAETLQGFIAKHAAPGATVCTDEATAYKGLPYPHLSVAHSSGQYVKQALDLAIHVNGMESFWSSLKRAHKGTFHKISPKHLNRYVQEFAGKHNIRESGTLAQMRDTVARLVGRRLLYRDLVADNGLDNAAA